ncbi:MAG: tRNA-dihydrouridine synthase family protein [Phycisphaeraceae bacterium]|nr:MAG: tRNA-dihydrouridine synthase family protein [Phycisphaeraceae bacterium]
MACHGNNATPPSPAIAPGAERIDPAEAALGARIDPRIPALMPGFDAPFFQAGLAGYSDAAMRIIARRLGCPCCVTEALLDRTLLAGGRGFAKADLGDLHDNIPGGAEDHPLVGQIMGSDPEEMAVGAVKMAEQGRRGERAYRDMVYTRPGEFPRRCDREEPKDHAADESLINPDATFQAIDVNLACPVKKISAKARGGHWLADPDGALEILKAVRQAVPESIPVTVKLRRGSDDSPEAERNFMRLFDGAYELGCAWTTVHGRTVEQKYVGPSRWTFLRELVQRRPDCIIFGSGDVWDVHDIFRMIAYTGVHAVSVARGCIGNPWIFRQARQMMAGETPTPPTIAEQRDVLEQHFMLSVALNGERKAGLMMRKFGVRFAAHHPQGEEVRREFIAVKTVEDWRTVLNTHYEHTRELMPSA